MFRSLRWNPRTAGPTAPSNRKHDNLAIVIWRPPRRGCGPAGSPSTATNLGDLNGRFRVARFGTTPAGRPRAAARAAETEMQNPHLRRTRRLSLAGRSRRVRRDTALAIQPSTPITTIQQYCAWHDYGPADLAPMFSRTRLEHHVGGGIRRTSYLGESTLDEHLGETLLSRLCSEGQSDLLGL